MSGLNCYFIRHVTIAGVFFSGLFNSLFLFVRINGSSQCDLSIGADDFDVMSVSRKRFIFYDVPSNMGHHLAVRIVVFCLIGIRRCGASIRLIRAGIIRVSVSALR